MTKTLQQYRLLLLALALACVALIASHHDHACAAHLKMLRTSSTSALLAAQTTLRDALHFSEKEISLLSRDEIVFGYGADLRTTVDVDLNEKYFFSALINDGVDRGREMFRYVNPDDSPVPINDALPVPIISVSAQHSMNPHISVPDAFDHDGNRLLTLFEFDISPDFNTPNYWRYPALLPGKNTPDRWHRFGMKFVFATALDATGLETAIQLPFRVTAMRLPTAVNDLSPAEMRKHAAALGWGLNKTQVIREVFDYVRFMVHWGDDRFPHTPYDTFRSGVGECGHVNYLAGVFLELNGIPYRGVSGFNPIARTVYPGGGHSAIEVWNEALGEWTYLDSYLNIRLDGPISNVENSELRHLPIYPAKPEISELGDHVGLGELFRFIRYHDKAGRLPGIPLHNMLDHSDDYGRFWKMAKGRKYNVKDLFPDALTVYVRARYIDTNGVGLYKKPQRAESFSRHSLTHFTAKAEP